MIKAIITDVDGVIVGKTLGFNFPHPNTDVLKKIKQVRNNGIPVILCTGKGLKPNLFVIQQSHLNNPHITNGGGLISDPLDNRIIAQYPIEKNIVKEIVSYCLAHDVYVEIYYEDNYAIQKSQESEDTVIHREIMQQEPVIVEDLEKFSQQVHVIKILCVVKNKEFMIQLDPLFVKVDMYISHVWTIHPSWLPKQVTLITAKDASKKLAAEVVLKTLGVSFEETLGIGDTLGDWKFMNHCKYVGIVGNESNELIARAKTKGEGNFYIADSVEKNGILDVLKYFNL